VRQLQGQTLASVPVVGSISPATVGVDLTRLANKTESFGQDQPYKLALFVPLSGGTSVMLVLYVHDSEQGWACAADTGNLGMLGGQTLPSDNTYVFMIQNIGIFDQLVLLEASNVGGVTIGEVDLVEYIERPEDRKQ
jgi:hypothetical protein